MITEEQIYWLTRMDYLRMAVFFIGLVPAIACAIVAIVFGFATIDADEPEISQRLKSAKRWTAFSLLFGLVIPLASFVPTTKEMAAIKLVPKIVNDEQVQEIPDKLLGLVDEWLDELRPLASQEVDNEK